MATMEYRKLPHGDEQISVIGLGMDIFTRGVKRKSKKRSGSRGAAASTFLIWRQRR